MSTPTPTLQAAAASAGGWGIFALTMAYTAVYARGAWVQWR